MWSQNWGNAQYNTTEYNTRFHGHSTTQYRTNIAPSQSVKRRVQPMHPVALPSICLVPAGILLSPSRATLHVWQVSVHSTQLARCAVICHTVKQAMLHVVTHFIGYCEGGRKESGWSEISLQLAPHIRGNLARFGGRKKTLGVTFIASRSLQHYVVLVKVTDILNNHVWLF